MNGNTIERAFHIADDAMYELLESEGVPGDEHRTVFGFTNESSQEVNALAESSTAMQEAFEWLSQRGYVELGSDGNGEFVQVITRPGDDGYAGVPVEVTPHACDERFAAAHYMDGRDMAVPCDTHAPPIGVPAAGAPVTCVPGRRCERHARGLGACVAGHCYPPAPESTTGLEGRKP